MGRARGSRIGPGRDGLAAVWVGIPGQRTAAGRGGDHRAGPRRGGARTVDRAACGQAAVSPAGSRADADLAVRLRLLGVTSALGHYEVAKAANIASDRDVGSLVSCCWVLVVSSIWSCQP